MAVKQVLIVRHGETDYNVAGRAQGMLETPLNANGIAQSQALAAYFVAQQTYVDAIYSSDLSRAFDTATIIGAALRHDVIPDERLREMNLGIFQGLTWDERIAKYPDIHNAYATGDMDYMLPQGESRRQFQDRAYAAFEELVASDDHEHIMLVSHGGTIKYMLRRILNDDALDFGHIGNTSLTILTRQNPSWQLTQGPQTPHLTTQYVDDDSTHFT